MTAPACPIAECGATPEPGEPPMKCQGYGHRDTRCMGNWLSIDPEDAGTYAEYLDHEAGECSPDCPYTTVHECRARAVEKGAL